MIKAEELRIGNLVIFDGKVDKIVAIDSDRECGELKTAIKLTRSSPWLNNLEPIPLDEAWLVKMKFHRWGESNTFGNGKVIIHKRKRGWVINTKAPVMESVHQFMNYHYAVTGVELTVL